MIAYQYRIDKAPVKLPMLYLFSSILLSLVTESHVAVICVPFFRSKLFTTTQHAASPVIFTVVRPYQKYDQHLLFILVSSEFNHCFDYFILFIN